jgi:hypothetical protein
VGAVENGGVLAQALHHLQHISPPHRVKRGSRLQNEQVRIITCAWAIPSAGARRRKSL